MSVTIQQYTVNCCVNMLIKRTLTWRKIQIFKVPPCMFFFLIRREQRYPMTLSTEKKIRHLPPKHMILRKGGILKFVFKKISFKTQEL